MPLKLYCPSCSEPTEYTLQKPVFCALCGSKFQGSVSAAIKKPVIKTEIDEDSNEDSPEINVSALQLDVPISVQKDKGITVAEIIKQKKTGITRSKSKPVNKQKELAKFFEDAGAGGMKPIEVQDTGPE